jgi:hypothetical protein
VLTWSEVPTDASNAYRTLRWQHFAYDTNGTLSLGPLHAAGYIMFGPPSVSYKGPTTSNCAYMFAWKNPGNVWYTRCKAADRYAGLTLNTEVSHAAPSGKRVSSPRIGSSNFYSELVNVWR